VANYQEGEAETVGVALAAAPPLAAGFEFVDVEDALNRHSRLQQVGQLD